MIPAGRLDNQLTLIPPGEPYRDPETKQELTRDPVEIPNVWAERVDRGGAKRREGEAEVGVWTTRFRIRSEPRVDRVNPRWKVRDERGYIYEIEAVGKVGREGWNLFAILRV